MDKILQISHWKIFILVVLGLIATNTTINNDALSTLILKMIGMMIYFSHPLLIGHFLYDYLPKKIELNYTFFLINSFVWFVVYFLILILSDGKGMTFIGITAIPFFYVFYAFLHFLSFPVRVLNSIETNEKASLSNYIGDFFLILFLPVGIWFLQPRINKIARNKNDY